MPGQNFTSLRFNIFKARLKGLSRPKQCHEAKFALNAKILQGPNEKPKIKLNTTSIPKREYSPEQSLPPYIYFVHILAAINRKNDVRESRLIFFPAQALATLWSVSAQKLHFTKAVAINLPYIPHFLLQPARNQKAEVYLLDRNPGKIGAKVQCLPPVAGTLA